MKLNAIRCTPQLLRPTYKLVFKIDNFLIRGIDFIFPIGLGQILGLSPFSLGALTRLQSGPLQNVGREPSCDQRGPRGGPEAQRETSLSPQCRPKEFDGLIFSYTKWTMSEKGLRNWKDEK